ncbi:MAG: response regulator transcription factor [Bacteroidales bacterium]|nr:response regulator transcription factor [Bacteroidales bacterium]
MIRSLIIEDEMPAYRRLQKLISETAPDIEISAHLESISSSVAWLQNNPHPDLIFLDIHLADGLCFEIFRQVHTDSFVIFTTAYDEYAIKAFELKSVDYLLKPVSKEHLERALIKFRAMKKQVKPDLYELIDIIENRKTTYKTRFVINVGNKIKTVETSEIAYFYSLEKATFLRSSNGKNYPVDFSLDKLELLLDPGYFFRISRQYLVNFSAIKNIQLLSRSSIKIDLNPPSDDWVCVSNNRAPDFRKWLDR